ncbi:alpha-(1,3)-fucosyltransferase fut-1-like [Watersipora subatra]|uniref:alpha-(1,3)-fucosyltransferase fut-1-like n=1 Tax=Watersipora subatra TaxID=2589382 RepID=UPI00355BD905
MIPEIFTRYKQNSSTISAQITTNTTTVPPSSLSSMATRPKLILQPTIGSGGKLVVIKAFNKLFSRTLTFENCEFFNCVFQYSSQLSDIAKADVVLQGFWSPLDLTTVQGLDRSNQAWIVYSHEPAGLTRARWKAKLNDYNATMTYTRDAAVYFPWGETLSRKGNTSIQTEMDYAENKTQGAYAYVSNCQGTAYERLPFMKSLANYINVEIFGGCTNNRPCLKGDSECEAVLHHPYRFYLAFENSLCKDYISEKFWKTLHSDGHFVPVVVGGLSVEDYTRVAPPDSFIHAYNFSSIKELGEYLQHLMKDDAAYNRYHEWRKHYTTSFMEMPQTSRCELCRIANQPKESLKSVQHRQFADEFNNRTNCRKLPFPIGA